MKVALASAFGALSLLARMPLQSVVESYGVTEAEWKLLTGELPWIASERHVVRKALDAVCSGSMDAAGLPHFDLPAEYIAGVIVAVVSPTNMMAACRIMERTTSAQSIYADGPEGDVSPKALFALVCSMHDGRGGEDTVGQVRKQVAACFQAAGKKGV